MADGIAVSVVLAPRACRSPGRKHASLCLRETGVVILLIGFPQPQPHSPGEAVFALWTEP